MLAKWDMNWMKYAQSTFILIKSNWPKLQVDPVWSTCDKENRYRKTENFSELSDKKWTELTQFNAQCWF
jgi:hypothetical protein